MATADSAPAAVPPARFLNRVESWLEKGSEWLNPILVKEARQALKSRQFSLTFILLLGCGWAWSFLRVAMTTPGIYYAPEGAVMLAGYLTVLAIPMLVIIPFVAYRSLAGEREDGTFELLSITTLSARQIVTGKLCSAVLQMTLYYSALSPCIAFTYLLRGIDVVMIAFLLAYTFLISIALSTAALMFATITRAKHWQTLISVVVMFGLGLAAWGWCYLCWEMLDGYNHVSMDQTDFWMAQAALTSALVSFSLLFVIAAAGRISFASDNRSTRLRITMLGQQVLLIGWMCYWGWEEGGPAVVAISLMAALYWTVAGSLMAAEDSNLSPRARRALPQSFLGRMVFTWFNPGSGTGYFFAIANMAVVVLMGSGLAVMVEFFQPTSVTRWWSNVHWSLWTILAYMVIYLGIGRWLYLAVTRIFEGSLILSFFIHLILVVSGAIVPWFLQSWLSGFTNVTYSVLQTPNWAWTLLVELQAWRGAWNFPEVSMILLATASAVGLINVMLVSRDISATRESLPDRVLQDEKALHPERYGIRKQRSPWDDQRDEVPPINN